MRSLIILISVLFVGACTHTYDVTRTTEGTIETVHMKSGPYASEITTTLKRTTTPTKFAQPERLVGGCYPYNQYGYACQ